MAEGTEASVGKRVSGWLPVVVVVVTGGFLAILGMAVATGNVQPLGASVFGLLGVWLGVFGTTFVIQALAGQPIRFQSHWGGLGSGLGGWQISPALAMLLATLLIAGVLASVYGAHIGGQPAGTAEAGESSTETRPWWWPEDEGLDGSKPDGDGAAQ